MTTMPKFTPAEAAKVLHVSEGTIRRLISQRKLRAERRRIWLIDADTLLDFEIPKKWRGKSNEIDL